VSLIYFDQMIAREDSLNRSGKRKGQFLLVVLLIVMTKDEGFSRPFFTELGLAINSAF
jgi:hypothetical protein